MAFTLGLESDTITEVSPDLDGTQRLGGRYRGKKKVVLVAVDESKYSLSALKFFIDTFYQTNQLVVLVHGVETPYQPMRLGRSDIVHDTLKKVQEETKRLLTKFSEVLKSKNVDFCTVSEVAKPGELIVKTAKEQGASLVVVGGKGISKLRRAMVGGVRDYVLKHAPCNVLLCSNKDNEP